MKRNLKGQVRQDGALIECELNRLDTYNDVVEKVAKYALEYA